VRHDGSAVGKRHQRGMGHRDRLSHGQGDGRPEVLGPGRKFGVVNPYSPRRPGVPGRVHRLVDPDRDGGS
jgi:hypothetical protein